MNRWKTGGIAALMVMALSIAGCDQQGDDVTSPDIDLPTTTDDAGTSPGMTDGASPGMTDDAGTDMSPSPTSS